MTPTPDDPTAQETSAAARLDGVLAAAEREIAAILAAAETAATADLEARSAELETRSSRVGAREAEADARTRHLDDRHRSLDERARALDARQDELDALTAELVQRRAALEVRDTELTEISAGLLASAVAAQEHARRLMDLPPLGAGALEAPAAPDGASSPEAPAGGSAEPQDPDGRDAAGRHGDPDGRSSADASPTRPRIRHLRDASDPDPAERSAAVGPRPSTPAGLREVAPRENRWETDPGTETETGAEPSSPDATFADHGSLPIVGGSSDEDITAGSDPVGRADDAAAREDDGAGGDAAWASDAAKADTADADTEQADGAPRSGDAHAADRQPGSAGAAKTDDAAEHDADDEADAADHTPEADVETDPPEKLDSARLAALSMAAEGRSREEVEAVLRDDLKIIDHASLIDYVFGISTPSSIVPSWPPRRRRRS